jgi:hypothetical protein
MTRTFTLPKSLLEETRSLCDVGAEEWLDDSALLSDLIDEFNDYVIPAPVAIVERAMAYSASHQMRPSDLMEDGHVIFLN